MSMGAGTFAKTNWLLVVSAGLLGAIGMLALNGMLAKATPQNVSTLFILMLIVQVVAPAVYQVVVGGLTLAKGVGFVLAAIAALLLLI